MKKLLLVAAFAIIGGMVNVNAVATRAATAQDPEHPVTRANAEARKAGRVAANVNDIVRRNEEAINELEAEKGSFQRAKMWASDHKGHIALGAGVTVVAGLLVDAMVRKDKSLVMQLVNLIKGTKAEKPVLAEAKKQLNEVVAR